MDVKAAVRTAKTYVSDLFAEEKITDLGLEEVDFDPASKVWAVTLGFSRPWETYQSALDIPFRRRAYKIVKLSDDDGAVISVRDRELAA
jgi:hypothetical protein